jgi:hypothetical protein
VSEIAVIPEVHLRLDPQTPNAKSVVGFKCAGDGIGNRSKIGGSPNWIQASQTPLCSCGEQMSFYGQLDSLGDKHCLADCGLIYVFVCFDCFATQAILQSA